MANLILILGDQLSHHLSALEGADKDNDLVVMAEVHSEASYTNHHKKKLVFVFSAMRHFADALAEDGWRVHYQRYHPDNPAQSIEQVIAELVRECQPERVITTECGEWRLHEQISRWHKTLGIPVEIRPDTRFVCNIDEFARWAEGRKQLRMEFFYREMRKKTGLLMTSEGQPEGGQWNFDTDNRKKWAGKPPAPAPFREEPDAITTEVIELVNEYFSEHFGTTEGFHYAVTAEQALEALAHFVDFALPCFGDYQDAISDNEDWLFHSILSPYLNTGLLDPMEVCEEAVRAWHAGRAPLNAVEGFVRQIIGWREFMAAMYRRHGVTMRTSNFWNFDDDPIPEAFYTGSTGLPPIDDAIRHALDTGYCHHIERLMLLGNLMLLCGFHPNRIYTWFMELFVDAYDWVMVPNVYGMSQFADGGIFTTKPYISGSNYVRKMSDYRKGPWCEIWDGLFWSFIHRHDTFFRSQYRLAMMARNLDRMGIETLKNHRKNADQFLESLQ